MSMKLLRVVCVLVFVSGPGIYGQQKEKSVMKTAASAERRAQRQEDIQYFRLDFVMNELEDGKVILSWPYSMEGNTGNNFHGSIRYNTYYHDKSVPPGMPGDKATVNLDCMALKRIGDSLSARVDVNISAPNGGTGGDVGYLGSFEPKVHLSERAVIFSSKDVYSGRTVQLELTVTPVP